MNIIEMILIGIGVSADAFAVSVSKGLSIKNIKINHIIIIGLWFGIFQFLMPFIGFILSLNFYTLILQYDHWISFVLLVFLGIKMIKDKDNEELNINIDFKTMLILSIATSIDALAVGVAYNFAYGKTNYLITFIVIGILTFILSSVGVIIGNLFNKKIARYANKVGGIILISIGTNILLKHLGVI